jgi:hypothetical protein
MVPPTVTYKPVAKEIPSPKEYQVAAVALNVFTITVVAADVLSQNLRVPEEEEATKTPLSIPLPVFTNADAVVFNLFIIN